MKAWRDISKQVPATDVQVLAYSTSEGYIILTFDEDEQQFFDDQFRFVKDVVYWMHIPILPNE
jgi:predicted nuclease of predicted toxin-antitoxin system